MSVRKKGGLGRGLGALIQEKTEKSVESTPTEAPETEIASGAPPQPTVLPIDLLLPNRLQPRVRFDDDQLAELADSIRAQGIIQPLVVAATGEGTFIIVAGERRWRAARRAGLTEVPVVVREVNGDRHLLELALVENLQRSDLNPIEEAEALLSLQGFGLQHEEIASRVGKSRSAVSNSLRLLRLPDDVRELMRSGALTAGQARPLLGLASEEAQIALAERAVSENLSARDLERITAEPQKSAEPPAARPKPAVDSNTAAALESLTRKLQTRIEIRRRGKGGQLQVHFHSEEELIRLYDLLMGRAEES
ncbi:MAG TPA: ParB/RepB/Spo0J family partition protein [Thermoanaerobaculia bacterium]|nr:ParB/RepB/Spo0J family partition protein [Thermoanaerobaculia bacterium]